MPADGAELRKQGEDKSPKRRTREPKPEEPEEVVEEQGGGEEVDEIEEILGDMPRETVEDRRERIRAFSRLQSKKVQTESPRR